MKIYEKAVEVETNLGLAKATGTLQEEIKEELDIEDPEHEMVLATLRKEK